MSANSDDPLEFLRFARRWQPAATADDFLPRELYGEYLECSLRSAEDASAPEVELQRTYGLVIAIEKIHRTSTLQVHLADGQETQGQRCGTGSRQPAARAAAGKRQLARLGPLRCRSLAGTPKFPCWRDRAHCRYGPHHGRHGDRRMHGTSAQGRHSCHIPAWTASDTSNLIPLGQGRTQHASFHAIRFGFAPSPVP